MSFLETVADGSLQLNQFSNPFSYTNFTFFITLSMLYLVSTFYWTFVSGLMEKIAALPKTSGLV